MSHLYGYYTTAMGQQGYQEAPINHLSAYLEYPLISKPGFSDTEGTGQVQSVEPVGDEYSSGTIAHRFTIYALHGMF